MNIINCATWPTAQTSLNLVIFHRVLLHILCVDSSTPPFFYSIILLWSAKENLLPFTANKESEALIAKSTLSLFSPRPSSRPSFSPRHFKCAPCGPQEERRVKNAFLNDTLASELLKILFAIALLPEFEVFNFCLMLGCLKILLGFECSPPLLSFFFCAYSLEELL